MAQDAVTGPKNEPRFSESGAPEIGTDNTIVAAYAALVGNKKGGTDADRLALTGKDLWEGLFWQNSDGTKTTWLYTAGTWVRVINPLANKISGSAIAGITIVSSAVPAGTAPITKTGFVHGFTTSTLGNGYLPTIVFDTAFPTACTGLAVTPISIAGVASSDHAIDNLTAAQFRVMYPGAGSVTERAYMWTATGY